MSTIQTYTPEPVPIDIGEAPLQEYLAREFARVSVSFEQAHSLLLEKVYAPPTKPEEGLFAFADGVTWNPGSGQGVYVYIDGSWVGDVIGPAETNFMSWPAGTSVDYWGSTAPAGSRFCHGQALSRTTFAALFAIIGTTYGVGDGTTTFNLPDCRGRVTAGQDDMGGTSANRLTNFAGGVDGDVLGAFGGLENHTLTTAQLASHAHTQQGTFNTGTVSADHTHADNTVIIIGAAGFQGGPHFNLSAALTGTGGISVNHIHAVTISGATVAAGSGTAHNNVQPTIVCNKLITTGGVV